MRLGLKGRIAKIGALMLEHEVFRKQIYCIEECTCDIVGTMRRPWQSFGSPIVIRRQGNWQQ